MGIGSVKRRRKTECGSSRTALPASERRHKTKVSSDWPIIPFESETLTVLLIPVSKGDVSLFKAMIKRIAAGAFGAVVLGISVPVLYILLIGVPASLLGIVWIALIGVATGAVLGALFPKFFGFVFETMMDI